MMSVCIYCGNAEATSSEHILQDSLGSDFQRKNILCPECNNLLGRTIDGNLAKEFLFFRNYLSISGKKGNVPTCQMEDVSGNKIARNGDTGAISTMEKPDVIIRKNSDGTQVISVTSQISNTEGIIKGLEKGFIKDGVEIKSISVNEYRAEPVGMLKAEISFSLPTYIALRKSLINFWCLLRRVQDLSLIQAEAKKIYDFAKFCDHNNSDEDRVQYAKSLGLDGFPLTVKISTSAKNILKGNALLYNSIFLVNVGGSLYGGVCLFNEIPWGFKISDTSSISNVEFLTFNIIDRKIEKEQNNSSKLNSSDFNFLFLEDRDRLEAAQKYISEAVNKCCVMDHYAAVQQAVNGDDITKFPITGQDAIHAVLLERTAILLGWLFLEFEIKPDFFKSEIGKLIVESFVLRFLQDIGPNCTLTVDVYKQYIAFCTMIGKDATRDSKYISALKHLHSIYMRSCS